MLFIPMKSRYLIICCVQTLRDLELLENINKSLSKFEKKTNSNANKRSHEQLVNAVNI